MNQFNKYFYQQILSHIHDPLTWRSYALTCKFFGKLCRNEAPARKLEFRVSISEWLFGAQLTFPPLHIHINAPSRFGIPLVLPNGALHGTVKTGIDGSDDDTVGDIREVDTGRITEVIAAGYHRLPHKVVPIRLPNYIHMLFIRNVLIVSDCWTNVKKTVFYNLTKTTFIMGYSCCICNKIHTFGIAGSALCYNRTCFETKYTLTMQTNADWKKMVKRRRLARAILDYAKSLQ